MISKRKPSRIGKAKQSIRKIGKKQRKKMKSRGIRAKKETMRKPQSQSMIDYWNQRKKKLIQGTVSTWIKLMKIKHRRTW